MFKSWLDNFESAINKKTNGLKWAMYSGHDNNIGIIKNNIY